jgi:alpha-galactosidase
MSKALNATGRPILYSLCNWGEDYPWYWARTIANSWRISGDIYDNWDTPDVRCPCDGQNAWNCGLPGSHCSIINIINKAAFVSSKSYPGAWNDLDMLEVGNGAMTDAEYVAHFSLWAAVKSPLIMGNDLRIVDAPTLSILSHAPMIAVNQDPLGSSASRRYLYYPNPPGAAEPGSQSLQMWSGNLVSTTGGEENDVIVLLINGFSNVRVMTASLADIFVDSRPNRRARQLKMRWEVRDLWANRMSDEEARWIIGNSTTGSNDSSAVRAARFNATKTSYAEGLLNKDERLLGSVVATVVPSGTITAKVGAHGCKAFRLRAVGGHDEL